MKCLTPIVVFIFSLTTSIYPFEATPQSTKTHIPCVFKNDLISTSIPISDSDTLHMYTDTGGKNYLYKSGIKKLGIKKSGKDLWDKSNIETLFENNDIPIAVKKQIYYLNDKSSDFDGMLGREWFAYKTWTFDYAQKTLSAGNPYLLSDKDESHIVNLYFKKDSLNNPVHNLPRVNIVVDGDTLSMLFDTGAQAILSNEAENVLHQKGLVATSFINASIFEMWEANHPEWPVLKNADLSFNQKSDMILVPNVKIGNKTLGSVGFVKRDDSNFQVMSAYFMDEEIVGAIGGNLFKQLKRFTIDYKKEILILID